MSKRVTSIIVTSTVSMCRVLIDTEIDFSRFGCIFKLQCLSPWLLVTHHHGVNWMCIKSLSPLEILPCLSKIVIIKFAGFHFGNSGNDVTHGKLGRQRSHFSSHVRFHPAWVYTRYQNPVFLKLQRKTLHHLGIQKIKIALLIDISFGMLLLV